MAVKISQEVARSLCERIREENRSRPFDPQALQCRRCESCSGGAAIRLQTGVRPCCLVRQRCARLLAMAV